MAVAPLVVATTSLPKRALSYRWIITDAKIFLQELLSYPTSSLKSPAFSITVPLRTESAGLQKKVLWWYLTLSRFARTYTDWRSKTKTEYYLCATLWQDKDRNEEAIDHQSNIGISDCAVSVIKHDSEEVLRKHPVGWFWCAINRTNSPAKAMSFERMFLWSDIDKHLCDGTLTIQVDAILKFVTDHMETLHTEPTLPLNNVSTGMKKMLSNGLHSDLTIRCGRKEFKVHKAVLASQSPVFRRMLESDMKEQRTNVIEISDVDQAVISDMLAYIYTGSAPNLDTLVRELLNVANKYELSGLFTMCERELKLKISLNNVIELLQLADMLNSSYLKKACLNYISLNSGAVRSSEEWKQLKENSEEHVSLLIMMDIMDCLLKC